MERSVFKGKITKQELSYAYRAATHPVAAVLEVAAAAAAAAALALALAAAMGACQFGLFKSRKLV
jgi:hypothetical protein